MWLSVVLIFLALLGCSTTEGRIFEKTPEIKDPQNEISPRPKATIAAPTVYRPMNNRGNSTAFDNKAYPGSAYYYIGKNNDSVKFVTACTLRRINFNRAADFIDCLSDSVVKDIVVPLDDVRTFTGDSWTFKLTASLNQSDDSAFLGFSLSF